MQKNVLLNLLDSIVESVFTIKDMFKQSEFEQRKIVAVDFGNKRDTREQTEKVVDKKEDNNDLIKLKDAIIRIRETKSGSYHEIRYRKNGYCKSFMSKVKKIALQKFSAWASAENKKRSPGGLIDSRLFKVWAKEALELKRPLIKPVSFITYEQIFKKYLLPRFGNLPISSIKPADIQKLVNELYEQNKTRLILDVKIVSGYIFETAVKNDLISKNPVSAVMFPKHYRQNGTAFSIEEEKALIERIKGSHYEPAILFMLYSGCRRSEVIQLKRENFDLEKNTVAIPCAKVKGRKDVVFRVVPIFPYLRAVILRFWDNEKAYNVSPKLLSEYLYKATNGVHHLHELRHTFITRAKECDVNGELVATWAGHDFEGVQKRGKITATVYTHFSESFQQEEAKKLKYLD